jgi:glucosamine--fructose-6-phosphate aminotransferase (isomerizing)
VKKKLLRELSVTSECRGKDATGIAYNSNDELRIFKVGKPAHRVKLYFPDKTRVVMGHTRAATQGSPKSNQNNHPFYGQTASCSFSVAHNGVLWASEYQRIKHSLPKTTIECDSYLAVQLLNRYDNLSIQNLAEMVETIDGSYSFTILDNHNNLYFIKGDCPLTIAFFEEIGLYVYASTPTILCRALKKTGLDGITPAMINLKSGDILRIGSDGETESGTFETFNYNSWFPLSALRSPYESNSSLHELIELGRIAGVKEDEIQQLFDAGYETTEIEEMLEYPVLLHKQLDFIDLGCNDDFEL